MDRGPPPQRACAAARARKHAETDPMFASDQGQFAQAIEDGLALARAGGFGQFRPPNGVTTEDLGSGRVPRVAC